ncbi:radical SAM/SPASM domain-containing protein [Nocardia suismassiliense]|uniref:radical SAM/SPASM domain-containing protein n=1 Tax=Nocardia suismassiliense TaxID=2077092 RepID=UPI000D1E3500|nr:radical SAM protein [Nocardia suismassiliense]
MEVSSATSIGLIVKATRSCNLRCTYCGDWRPGSGNTMSFEVLARLICVALAEPRHHAVRFSWHGGEPTLLPRDYFRKAMALQHRFRRPGQWVTNSIMTNATRVTAEWAEFLRENEFTVGVSLDGPPEIHDRYRVDAAGRPTYQRAAQGMQMLRDHQVDFAVTVVLDEAGYAFGPDKLFDFLVGEGITNFGINFVVPKIGLPPEQARHHYIDPQRRSRYLIGLYQRWKEYGDCTIRIRDLDALRRRTSGHQAGPCTLSGSCWGGMYTIEPNGDVCHCDFFFPDQTYVWGNVMHDSFDEIRSGAALTAALTRHEPARSAKSQCAEFSVCNGGCPHEYLMSERLNPHHDAGCCGLRELIGMIRSDGKTEPVLLPEPRVIG